jgi:hypothetical protein
MMREWYTEMFHVRIELSSDSLGSSILAVSDQWFAPAESLLKPHVSLFLRSDHPLKITFGESINCSNKQILYNSFPIPSIQPPLDLRGQFGPNGALYDVGTWIVIQKTSPTDLE